SRARGSISCASATLAARTTSRLATSRAISFMPATVATDLGRGLPPVAVYPPLVGGLPPSAGALHERHPRHAHEAERHVARGRPHAHALELERLGVHPVAGDRGQLALQLGVEAGELGVGLRQRLPRALHVAALLADAGCAPDSRADAGGRRRPFAEERPQQGAAHADHRVERAVLRLLRLALQRLRLREAAALEGGAAAAVLLAQLLLGRVALLAQALSAAQAELPLALAHARHELQRRVAVERQRPLAPQPALEQVGPALQDRKSVV